MSSDPKSFEFSQLKVGDVITTDQSWFRVIRPGKTPVCHYVWDDAEDIRVVQLVGSAPEPQEDFTEIGGEMMNLITLGVIIEGQSLVYCSCFRRDPTSWMLESDDARNFRIEHADGTITDSRPEPPQPDN